MLWSWATDVPASPHPGKLEAPWTGTPPPTHHNHTSDPVQEERDVDLAEELEQKPLTLVIWGQLPGANAAADIHPGGLRGGSPLTVAPEQSPASPPSRCSATSWDRGGGWGTCQRAILSFYFPW